MSEVSDPAAAAAAAADPAAAAAAAADPAAAAAAAAAPANWRDSLPDDIKGDATLARFSDVEALARGHLETHKLARSKLTVPGADATPEQWGQVFDALGRPKSADDYDVPMPELSVPEGASDEDKAAAAEALKAEYGPFRALAHEIGLTAAQAKRLGQFEVDRHKAFLARGEEEVGELRKQMGEPAYNARLEQAKAVFKQLGFPAQFADELDRKVGSAALVMGFMKLADLTGELPRIAGFGGEIGDDANAEATLKTKMADKSWREKLNSGDVTVKAEYDRLMEAAKRQGLGG